MVMALGIVLASRGATEADLIKLFRRPPAEFRPLQIIHGFDGLGKEIEVVRRRLRDLRKLGIGGLVVNVSSRDYLRSEEGWSFFLDCLGIAEELGFVLWLYDEEGYPSGAAGGLVLERNPDLEAIGLARFLEGGQPRYRIRRMYEGTHCTENVYKKRRYINILNEEAARTFIALTHEEYARRIPDIGGKIRAIFTDEPSLMTTYIRPPENAPPVLPWVEDLPEEFKRRRGYDLTPHLESLFGDVGDYWGIRCDFYETVAQLIAERFFGTIQDWCRRHGIASSGHLLAEERLIWHAMYYGDLMACLRQMDIPGVDMLTSDPRTIVLGPIFIAPKLASSAAHLEGQYEVMSETSDFVQRTGAWGGERRRASLAEMRATAAIQFLLGVNIITSYYPHPFGYREERSDYARYCDYVGRLALMLRDAEHVCDVAVLYPIAGIWASFYPTSLSMYQPHPSKRAREIDDRFLELCRVLLRNRIDFDVVDERAIREAVVERGGFRIAKERYRALVVPETDAVHLSTLSKMAEMKNRGVLIAAVGRIPRFAASRNESDEEVRRLAERILGDALLPDAGKLAEVLRDAGCGVKAEPPNPDLWAALYRRGGMMICFLVNVSAEPISAIVELPGWREAAIWSPGEGEIWPAEGRREGDKLRVSVTVPGFDCLFIAGG